MWDSVEAKERVEEENGMMPRRQTAHKLPQFQELNSRNGTTDECFGFVFCFKWCLQASYLTFITIMFAKDPYYFHVSMYVLIVLMSSLTPFIMSDQLSLPSGLNIICWSNHWIKKKMFSKAVQKIFNLIKNWPWN